MVGGITAAGGTRDPTSAYISPGDTWQERGAVLHTNCNLMILSILLYDFVNLIFAVCVAT